jgi:hypothetical protein
VPKAKTRRAKLYCLRIELAEIIPTIWRRIWIEERKSLIELHHTIQAAMGWTDAHLHEFQIGGVTYATPHPEDDLERLIVDERRVTLHKVLHGISQFGYLYDFGDGWEHTIIIEKRVPQPTHWRGCAFVETGERACPPEDAGGAHSHQEFLDQFARNPRHKGVCEFLEWAGKDFDPECFDRHATNAALLRMAWNGWGAK